MLSTRGSSQSKRSGIQALGWWTKPGPVDNATCNSVNDALQMLSHAECNTLDRFAESAGLLMRRSQERGYHGAFARLVFDHDQAYRCVKCHRAFRALVTVVSPGDTVSVDGADVFGPTGEVVFLEMWHLLFAEAGPVASYCCIARAIVVILAKVLALANGAYIDDFGATFWAEDKQLPANV